MFLKYNIQDFKIFIECTRKAGVGRKFDLTGVEKNRKRRKILRCL
jgi:hypothetical protein